jgi:hypothetical protein
MQWHIYHDYGFLHETIPEEVPREYHDIIKELIRVRKKLKNPVSSKGHPRPLMPATIRNFQLEEQRLSERKDEWKQAIKEMIKYNILPLSGLVSGKDALGFIFHLGVMIELPFLSEIVRSANRIVNNSIDDRDKNVRALILTLKDTIKKVEQKRGYYLKSRAKPFMPEKCQSCDYYLKAKGGKS